jgi:hypothetical protein
MGCNPRRPYSFSVCLLMKAGAARHGKQRADALTAPGRMRIL